MSCSARLANYRMFRAYLHNVSVSMRVNLESARDAWVEGLRRAILFFMDLASSHPKGWDSWSPYRSR
jgi:hypothetical protein